MDMTADDALSLARKFREAALAAGNFLYDNWAELDPRDRDTLRSLDITLQNVATDLVTQAVGITLDEAQTSIAKLAATTDKAKTALKKINDVKAAIGIVTALSVFCPACTGTTSAPSIFIRYTFSAWRSQSTAPM